MIELLAFNDRFKEKYPEEKWEYYLSFCREVGRKLNYHFTHANHLWNALSRCGENLPTDTFERMEYLGDSLLHSIVGVLVYKKYKKASPSDLTLYRSELVKNKNLAKIGKKYLDLDKLSQELGKGNLSEKNTADVFESIVGAVFLDTGEKLGKITEVVKYVFDQSGCLEIEKHSIYGMRDPKSYLLIEINKVFPQDSELEFEEKNLGSQSSPERYAKVIIKGIRGDSLFQGSESGPHGTKKEAQKEACKLAIEELYKQNTIPQNSVQEERE